MKSVVLFNTPSGISKNDQILAAGALGSKTQGDGTGVGRDSLIDVLVDAGIKGVC